MDLKIASIAAYNEAAKGYPGTGNPGFAEDESGYPNSNQSTIVVTQPVADVQVVSSFPFNVCLAIFTTICCCWPIGIFAIIRACQSYMALAAGDFHRAQTLSQESRRFSMFGIAIGFVFIIISVVAIVLVVNRTNYYQGRFYH